MIKINDLELYASFSKELHGHFVRIDRNGFDGKKKMIVMFVPKEEMSILLGGLISISSDETHHDLDRQINDQLNTEISVTKCPSNIIGKDIIYRILVKSDRSIIETQFSTDHMETLTANMKVLVRRDLGEWV